MDPISVVVSSGMSPTIVSRMSPNTSFLASEVNLRKPTEHDNWGKSPADPGFIAFVWNCPCHGRRIVATVSEAATAEDILRDPRGAACRPKAKPNDRNAGNSRREGTKPQADHPNE